MGTKTRNLLFVFALLLCTFIRGAESQVDFRIDADPNNLAGKTSFNITTTTSLPDDAEKHAVIFVPEMSFYTNQSIDFSVTLGHRHRYKRFVWGHMVFFDRSNLDGISLDQIGTGLDLQTPLFDFRVNYYHPVTKFKYSPIQPSKWVDGEIFFKTPYFGVGTGPLYNANMKAWALHSRIVIPLKEITLNFGALCGGGEYATTQAIFSVSFHIFKAKKINALTSPPCHVQKSSLYYNSGYALEKTGAHDTHTNVIMLDYNPNMVSYIEQSEDEMTLQDKSSKEVSE